MAVNGILKLIFFFSLIFILSVFGFIFINNFFYQSISSIEENVIPEIFGKSCGVQSGFNSEENPYYQNKEHDASKSDVVLINNIKRNQNVKRYIQIAGFVRPNVKLEKGVYRSVICEVESKASPKYYFYIPIDNFNRFTGFIYFKTLGVSKINLYLFIDNSASEKIIIDSSIKTTASVSFFVNVNENVPHKYLHLLPTKNIDCGNKQVRERALELTKDCKTNIEKVRKIYEYLVFGDDKWKMKYNKKTKVVVSCREIDYHNTYIASEILLKKRGVCNDFAEIFASMTRSVGFKVKKVCGFYDDSKKVGHMWNIIDLEGDEKKWCLVDATWGNVNKSNFKKWAELYPEFDLKFFMKEFKPYNHESFTYDLKVEY